MHRDVHINTVLQTYWASVKKQADTISSSSSSGGGGGSDTDTELSVRVGATARYTKDVVDTQSNAHNNEHHDCEVIMMQLLTRDLLTANSISAATHNGSTAALTAATL